jgi:FixJ family two-component response regulator
MNAAAPLVHVVDDDESIRQALTRLLEAAGHEVRSYASAGEFMLEPLQDRPGCLVLDVCLPGPNGLDLHDALRRREQPLPVIFLTGYGDIPMSVRAIKTGAIDFLTKPVQRDTLLGAISVALACDAALRRARANCDELTEQYRSLTPRERDVFQGVVAGKLNKQIAADLGAAERTVKAHRAHVMQKMRAASVADLVRQAQALMLTSSARPPLS